MKMRAISSSSSPRYYRLTGTCGASPRKGSRIAGAGIENAEQCRGAQQGCARKKGRAIPAVSKRKSATCRTERDRQLNDRDQEAAASFGIVRKPT
jgi:hypothetical protein